MYWLKLFNVYFQISDLLPTKEYSCSRGLSRRRLLDASSEFGYYGASLLSCSFFKCRYDLSDSSNIRLNNFSVSSWRQLSPKARIIKSKWYNINSKYFWNRKARTYKFCFNSSCTSLIKTSFGFRNIWN